MARAARICTGRTVTPKGTQICLSENFTGYKNSAAISSLLSLFFEEESSDGREHNYASPQNGLAQLLNIYILKGFTVGSKSVVWSNLRNTRSKHEVFGSS